MILLFVLSSLYHSEAQQRTDNNIKSHFYNILSPDSKKSTTSIKYLDDNWKDEFIAPLVEMMMVSDRPNIRKRLLKILKLNTDEDFGRDPYAWWQWLWDQDISYGSYYADLKGWLYQNVDPKFGKYFERRANLSKIRLDEILWGGVVQDGIPPLRDPHMLDADRAKYLSKKDIVFGIVIDGDARAYPQRILAWHEMVVDNIAGHRIAGVYCTLCGTVIAYDTEVDEVQYDLGTSGFLYRSNKLMYDKKTQSLWNTIQGRPVVGPLTEHNIELNSFPVVTSTWEEWKKRYPNTKVLDIKTGHHRDYRSGVAYKRYYATDKLMFPVPLEDERLSNKDEVLVIRSGDYKSDPIAISIDFLKKHPVYHCAINGTNYVVISSKKGGSRVYASEDFKFESYKDSNLFDSLGVLWQIEDDHLRTSKGIELDQVSSHNIFWFAWYNAYPQTRLVK